MGKVVCPAGDFRPVQQGYHLTKLTHFDNDNYQVCGKGNLIPQEFIQDTKGSPPLQKILLIMLVHSFHSSNAANLGMRAHKN